MIAEILLVVAVLLYVVEMILFMYILYYAIFDIEAFYEDEGK